MTTPRDVDQSDPHGIDICNAHADAMMDIDEVHVWWDKDSVGSKFDLGMAFILRRSSANVKFRLINPESCKITDHKSYENVMNWLCENPPYKRDSHGR